MCEPGFEACLQVKKNSFEKVWAVAGIEPLTFLPWCRRVNQPSTTGNLQVLEAATLLLLVKSSRLTCRVYNQWSDRPSAWLTCSRNRARLEIIFNVFLLIPKQRIRSRFQMERLGFFPNANVLNPRQFSYTRLRPLKDTDWASAPRLHFLMLNKKTFPDSPFSSTVIALALIIVEVVINMIWLIAEPPETDFLVDRGKNILVCGGVDVRWGPFYRSAQERLTLSHAISN